MGLAATRVCISWCSTYFAGAEVDTLWVFSLIPFLQPAVRHGRSELHALGAERQRSCRRITAWRGLFGISALPFAGTTRHCVGRAGPLPQRPPVDPAWHSHMWIQPDTSSNVSILPELVECSCPHVVNGFVVLGMCLASTGGRELLAWLHARKWLVAGCGLSPYFSSVPLCNIA
jgi:hypothetical protein